MLDSIVKLKALPSYPCFPDMMPPSCGRCSPMPVSRRGVMIISRPTDIENYNKHMGGESSCQTNMSVHIDST